MVDWINITGFTVTKSGNNLGDAGIELNNVQNCDIVGNNVSLNYGYGIYLYISPNNSIIGNNISSNVRYGIWLYSSVNTKIIDKNVVSSP